MDKFVFSFHNISPQSKKQLTAAIIQHGGSIAYVGSTVNSTFYFCILIKSL